MICMGFLILNIAMSYLFEYYAIRNALKIDEKNS